MATAQSKTVKVATVITTYKDEPQVTLVLSKDEAETLRIICACIGGTPDKTRRGHTDSITSALAAAGTVWHYDYPSVSGSINFNTESI